MSTFNTLSVQNYYKYDKRLVSDKECFTFVSHITTCAPDYSDVGERADALKDEGGKKQFLYILRIQATIYLLYHLSTQG